jgi:mRNA interferase MazF
MFRQRDVILTVFPFTDLSGSKKRPALIISSDSVNSTRDFVCVQITSKMFDDGFFLPLDNKMLLEPLLLKSGIRLQKIFTINEKLIEQKISELKPDAFDKLFSVLLDRVFTSR